MRRSLVYGFLFFLATASATAFAARQTPADAPLAKREQSHCIFNPDGSKDCTSTVHYTILKPSGREMLSRIDFTFQETDTLEVRQAFVTQPGGKPAALDAAHIDTRTAPNPDEGFTRMRQTSLAFPNLRTGTQISYTLQQHFAATPLAQGFHYITEFPPMPVRVDAYKAEFTASQPIVWRSELAEDFQIAASPDGKTLVIEQIKPRYVNYTNEADHAFLVRVPRIELGHSSSLHDYFDVFAARYNEILGAPLPPESAKLAKEIQSLPDEEKIARLMRHIHDNYRYLGDWRATERGHVPFTLAEIEQRGYGDCKDLSVLLAAMLRAAGMQADPALVARGQTAADLLIPGTYAPNHAIVRARLGGRTLWLDPTNPVYIPGRSMADIQERWAITLTPPGKAELDAIALEPPGLVLDVQRTEHHGAQAEAHIAATVELSNELYAQVSMSDREQGAAGTDDDLCARFGKEVAQCTLQRPSSDFIIAPGYRVQAELTDRQALQNVSGTYVYQRDDLAALWDDLAAYTRKGQQADLYFGDPMAVSHRITLTGRDFGEAPQACAAQSPWFDFSLAAETSPEGLRYQYRYAQKKRYLTHEEIAGPALQEVVAQARECIGRLRLVAR